MPKFLGFFFYYDVAIFNGIFVIYIEHLMCLPIIKITQAHF